MSPLKKMPVLCFKYSTITATIAFTVSLLPYFVVKTYKQMSLQGIPRIKRTIAEDDLC